METLFLGIQHACFPKENNLFPDPRASLLKSENHLLIDKQICRERVRHHSFRKVSCAMKWLYS